MKQQWINILIVGMTLGTAWAIRGQFGHEQGAAWAGGIGALALVLVSQRKDWYAKMLTIAFTAAVSWGASGMISYGQVVGYGRSDNFPNAFYGLLMLFVIGCLYGLLGGGMVGLSLQSSKENKVKWGALLTEMVAGAIVTYALLVDQLEILMTPPRQEAWAVCLGASLAMLWHMARNNYKSPVRVAFYSAIGAGFGFAFGNFLQTVGAVLEIQFNMWNVMEYSIGFFGGSGMAYGVFSSVWPEKSTAPERWENKAAFGFVFILVPFIVFIESMGYARLLDRIKAPVNPELVASLSSWTAFFVILAVSAIGYYLLVKAKDEFRRKDILLLFVVYLAAYTIISYIVSGAFAGVFLLNHHLYWVNLIAVLLLMRKRLPAFFDKLKGDTNDRKRWLLYFVALVVVIMILALISAGIHGEMSGAHDRFILD
jgi:hypothetical protein